MESAHIRVTLLIGSFAFLMACFCAQVLKLEQKFLEAREKDFRLAETIYMPPNEMARVISLGYEPFAADMVFMSANSYFTTHLIYDRRYQWLDTYLDAVIGYCRDERGMRQWLSPDQCEEAGNTWVKGMFPFNPRVFLWASQVIKFAPMLTDEIIDRSVYYGKTGIHFCPDDWKLYYDVGFNLYFEYREKSDEERQALRKEALEYFSLASLLPDSSVDPNFVAGVMFGKDESERAIRHVYQTYYHATDRQKKEIRSRVKVYGQQELADLLEDEERRWKEQYRYIPQGLYHVISDMHKPRNFVTTRGAHD